MGSRLKSAQGSRAQINRKAPGNDKIYVKIIQLMAGENSTDFKLLT